MVPAMTHRYEWVEQVTGDRWGYTLVPSNGGGWAVRADTGDMFPGEFADVAAAKAGCFLHRWEPSAIPWLWLEVCIEQLRLITVDDVLDALNIRTG